MINVCHEYKKIGMKNLYIKSVLLLVQMTL